MKEALKSFFAVFKGLEFCLIHKDIRKIAIWPWIVGFFAYLSSIFAAISLHAPLLNSLVEEPTRFFGYLKYYSVWVLVTLILLIATMILTLTIVMIFTSFFQTSIALKVLEKLNYQTPEEEPGVKGAIKETGRTILVESSKLIWLLPLMILALIIGFIPLLSPVALIIGAWLLAFQFIDITLDIYKLRAKERFKLMFKHIKTVLPFGLGLAIICLIPFMGIFIPPVAAASAAWLVSTNKLLELEELSSTKP